MSGNPFSEDGDGDRTVVRPGAGRNPFAEPDDGDRTVVRPMPGGSRGARPAPSQPLPPRPAAPDPPPPSLPARAAPPRADAPRRGEAAVEAGPDPAPSGVASAHAHPLLAAAEPLLLLLARMRAASPPDPGDVRARTLREVRAFERRAREAGVAMELLRPAHLALCASLDDAALNTPWGREAGWADAPLARALHQEARAGEAFFDQLDRLRDDPAARPVVELMYLCLSLGFMGPLRAAPDGQARADAIREETLAAIGTAEAQGKGAALSVHVQGVSAPYRPARKGFPTWVAGSAALAAVAGVFAWSLIGLNARSDELHARMLAAAPATMPPLVRAPFVQPPPPPPAPPEPGLADRLRAALQAEVEASRLAVLETPTGAVVRLGAKGLFAPGGASLQPAAAPLLARVAQVLREEAPKGMETDATQGASQGGAPAPPIPVRVVGYTDNQPTRTVRFPSNFQLSAAQAGAVRTAIERALARPGERPGERPAERPGERAAERPGGAGGETRLRLASEGRADADPIAPNASPEGREQNRRVEIVVQSTP